MKIVDRIYLYIKSKSLSLSEFDRSIGAANGYIGKQMKKGASIGSHTIEKIIYAHPDLSVRWLMTGEGNMLDESRSESVDNEFVSDSDESDLSVVEMDSEAVSTIANTLETSESSSKVDSTIYSVEEEFVFGDYFKNENYLCIRYVGESMLPNIRSGTYMIIKKITESNWSFLKNSIILLVTQNNKVFIGKISRIVANEWIILTKENPEKNAFPDIRVSIVEITSFWLVIGYMFAQPEDVSEQNMLEPINEMERKLKMLAKELDQLKGKLG